MDFWLFAIVIFLIVIGMIIYYFNETQKLKKENDSLRETISKKAHSIVTLRKDVVNANSYLEKYESLFDKTVNSLESESVLLPSVSRLVNALQKYEDEFIIKNLIHKKRPAYKASEEVKIARAKARACKKEVELSRNRVELYEKLAPWLIEYTEISLEDMLKDLKEQIKMDKDGSNVEDPISRYISKTEWHNLSETERNQLALERYCDPSRKISLWQVGIAYERFVGYEYEQQGYKVQYHGALHGKEDLGIDLICEMGNTILVVQCKRLSRNKKIPVRENVIAQIYGAAQLYKIRNSIDKIIIPAIITSFELSDEAKEFAKHLDVTVRDSYDITSYPMIKCNISRQTNDRIYHLPMDQQYDNVIIGNVPGELYATTVLEAETKGFRRAYRWSGNQGD